MNQFLSLSFLQIIIFAIIAFIGLGFSWFFTVFFWELVPVEFVKTDKFHSVLAKVIDIVCSAFDLLIVFPVLIGSLFAIFALIIYIIAHSWWFVMQLCGTIYHTVITLF